MISCVPTLLITTVNGTFLSPGATSILFPSVPKYASKNFMLITLSLKTPCGTSAGPILISPNDNGVSEVTIKNAKNTITNLFMLLSPL